jgi:hypothetical protein
MRTPTSRFFPLGGPVVLAYTLLMAQPLSTVAAQLPGVRPAPAGARLPAGKASYVYVSDTATNWVFGYDARSGQLVEQITGFSQPQGLATDRDGNLYVADSLNERVVVFPAGKTKASRVLRDPHQLPESVAIAPNGDVAVVNEFTDRGNAGSVSFYHAGATRSYATVGAPFFSKGLFCGYDRKGNLYVDGTNANDASIVVEIAGGGSGNAMVNLGISGVQQIGGLAVIRNGDYLVGDSFNNVVYEFAAGSNALVATIPLGVTIYAPSLTLSRSGTGIWVAALNFSSGAGEALEFSYPGGGAPVDTISVGSGNAPYGIAISP